MAERYKITIEKLNNGHVYEIQGIDRFIGKYVCKSTEEHQILKHIGEAICGYKIEVIRK